MKSIAVIAVALILPTVPLVAQRPLNRSVEVVTDATQIRWLPDAREIQHFADGSQWLIHALSSMNGEPSPIGVTRLSATGDVRSFVLADWLPAASMPDGWRGQIYSVAQLTDGRIAVSAGWRSRDEGSRNAVLVLRGRDGSYEADQVIRMRGTGRIAAGPRGTIVVLTSDATRRGGGPLVTVLAADGKVLGEYFDSGDVISTRISADNSIYGRIQPVAPERYALYQPSTGTVHLFDLSVAPAPRVTMRASVFIDTDPAVVSSSIVDIDTSAEGVVTVFRTEVENGRPRTRITRFSADGGVIGTWFSEYPWRRVLREGRTYRGVVPRDKVLLETVELPER